VIDGVFAGGEDGQIQFAEAGALSREDLAAIQRQVRQRVLRWFARVGHLDHADARNWRAGTTAGVSRSMPRCASTAPTAPGWSACCTIVPARLHA
jgi:hypothetical protein